MTQWSLLELTPGPAAGTPATDAGDIAALRRHVLEAEHAIIDLNRWIADAVHTGQRTDALEHELTETIEARDLMRARLGRLEGKPRA